MELADEIPNLLSITFEKLRQPGEVPYDWKKKENIIPILKTGKWKTRRAANKPGSQGTSEVSKHNCCV